MSIPSSEILKHPYTYIENIIFKKDIDTRTLESVTYNYAPFLLAENNTESLSNSISYDKNSEVKFLFDISKLYKFFNNKEYQISDSKKFILDILRALPTNSEFNSYTSIIKNICNNSLSNIKNYQYENKLLESALVNFSPIVPYSGIIKQPNMSESTMSNLDIDRQNSNIDNILHILNKPNSEIKDFIKNTLINNPFDIISNSNKFIKNDNYNKEYNIKDDDNVPDNLLPSDIISLLLSNSKYDISTIYFIITYIYYSFKKEQYPDVISKLTLLKNTMSDICTFKNTSVQTAMESMSNFNLPSISDSILDIDISNNMEYENDKKIEKLMDMTNLNYTDFKTKKYNLDKLLAYVYNSRRFETNPYTNSLFLNNNEIIEGYSYIQNGDSQILVCELDDRQLIIPVMDLSDNYKLKLITMDKDNIIQLTPDFKTT